MAILAVPLSARAEGKDDLVRAAQAACLSGDFAKGVAILAELYVNTRNATYIFNQGRCFEQSGKYQEAIVRFREYQRKNASAGRAADPEAEKHIAECQALLDKQRLEEPPPPTPPPIEQPAPVAIPATPVSPPAREPVPAAPTDSLKWYERFYGHIGGVLGLHGWGKMSGNFSETVTGKLKGGVLLSAYAPVSSAVHIGGYFTYASGTIKTIIDEKMDHYSVGLSLKAGSRVHERVWVGVVGDLGFYSLAPKVGGKLYGVEISPRLHLDVIGLSAGGIKMGPFASLGPTVVPYAAGEVVVHNGHDEFDGRAWLIYITLCLGATFGS